MSDTPSAEIHFEPAHRKEGKTRGVAVQNEELSSGIGGGWVS